MADKINAEKAIFTFGEGTAICLVSYDLPGKTVPTIDVTCLSDAHRNYIAGKPDLGTLVIANHHDPADEDQQEIYDSLGDGVTDHPFTLEIEGKGTYEYTGFAISHPISQGEIDNVLLITTTFQITSEEYTPVTPLFEGLSTEDEKFANLKLNVTGENVEVEVVHE